MADVIEINEEQFDKEVLAQAQPVLVDFWAPWCGPCKRVAPLLTELAAENTGKLKVVKVNVDENPALAERYDVMGIPTMVLFKGGQVVDSVTGALGKQELSQIIDRII